MQTASDVLAGSKQHAVLVGDEPLTVFSEA